jgi:ATP-binding cassette subfamily F protein 3
VLSGYPGTILLVSHDRYLINALASQIWEIDTKGESLVAFEGSYQAYLGNQDQEEETWDYEPDLSPIETDSYQDLKSAKNKALAADRKRLARLEEVEERIGALEVILEKTGKHLANPPEDPDQVAALGQEYREAEIELEVLLQEWESLQVEDAERS